MLSFSSGTRHASARVSAQRRFWHTHAHVCCQSCKFNDTVRCFTNYLLNGCALPWCAAGFAPGFVSTDCQGSWLEECRHQRRSSAIDNRCAPATCLWFPPMFWLLECFLTFLDAVGFWQKTRSSKICTARPRLGTKSRECSVLSSLQLRAGRRSEWGAFLRWKLSSLVFSCNLTFSIPAIPKKK